MKHNIVFLPWIGAVIGGLLWLADWLMALGELPAMARVCLLVAIPLLLTGGFHVDGFMDVEDAMQSYKSGEEKLEILKDPHIGAFAVIRLTICGLLWVAALLVLVEGKAEYRYAYMAAFFLTRCLCGIGSVKLPHAKKTGMLHMETKEASRFDFIFLLVETILVLGFLWWISPMVFGVMGLVTLLGFGYYRYQTKKQFGGVTGDTCGYYVVMSELWLVIGLALLEIMIGKL